MKTYFSFLYIDQTDLIAILFLCTAFYYNPRPKPSFNPFDEQFEVVDTDFINEKCDTIIAGCGYFNLEKNINGVKVYYQFHFDEKGLQFKALELDLDTIIFDIDSIKNDLYKKKVFSKNRISIDYIAQKMSIFKVQLLNITKDKDNGNVVLFKTLDNKIIEGYIHYQEVQDHNNMRIRRLGVGRSPQIKFIPWLLDKFSDYFREKVYIDEKADIDSD